MDVGNIVLKLRNDDMRAGSNGMGARNIVTDVGNDCLGVQSITTNGGSDCLGGYNISMDVGNGHVRVYCELGLGLNGQRRSCGGYRMYLKDMKDPVEFQPPGCDRIFITLRMEHPSDPITFIQLDDVLLDIGHSSVVGNLVSEYPGTCIAGSTHVVNCPIASKTD